MWGDLENDAGLKEFLDSQPIFVSDKSLPSIFIIDWRESPHITYHYDAKEEFGGT